MTDLNSTNEDIRQLNATIAGLRAALELKRKDIIGLEQKKTLRDEYIMAAMTSLGKPDMLHADLWAIDVVNFAEACMALRNKD